MTNVFEMEGAVQLGVCKDPWKIQDPDPIFSFLLHTARPAHHKTHTDCAIARGASSLKFEQE
jgi:hypothetical protein